MSEQVIRVERSGDVATVTLDRPTKMNALNTALRTAIHTSLAELDKDDAIAAVVLTGAGKAFCAGLDLKELGGEEEGGESLAEAVSAGKLIKQLEGMRKPLIGAINGAAITGGFEVALACDLLVASESARFADTHARVGILPTWGLSQRLSRTIGIYRAREMSLTGNFLDAATAERWGLVNRVVPADELLPTCQQLARDMASCDRTTMLAYKSVINEGYDLDLGDARRMERQRGEAHISRMDPNSVARRRAEVQQRGRSQT